MKYRIVETRRLRNAWEPGNGLLFRFTYQVERQGWLGFWWPDSIEYDSLEEAKQRLELLVQGEKQTVVCELETKDTRVEEN